MELHRSAFITLGNSWMIVEAASSDSITLGNSWLIVGAAQTLHSSDSITFGNSWMIVGAAQELHSSDFITFGNSWHCRNHMIETNHLCVQKEVIGIGLSYKIETQ